MSTIDALRDLPAVERLVEQLETSLPRRVLVDLARAALGAARANIEGGSSADPWATAADLVKATELSRTSKVLNATGVLLHTNLGRSPLSAAATDAMTLAAANYSNLELDLSSGGRGGRGDYLRRLLETLTGAEDAVVVNNNAAALLLSLAATSSNRAVPVARGELIEIGGSYRLPAVMGVSGARLIEVGTTNRTRVGDYQTALQLHSAGAILRVHPSNYRIEGFTEEAPLSELAKLAHETGVPLIHDVGSGLLDHEAPWLTESDRAWLRSEPGVRQSLEMGSDLVTFSGDKLLGGPQAGIVVGSSEAIALLLHHPLARALRIDGPTGAALAATLEAYANGTVDDIPFWRLAHVSEASLRPRLEAIRAVTGGDLRLGASLIGAGSVPGTGIPSSYLALAGAGEIYGPLLMGESPVATRRQEGDLIIDLRAVEEADDAVVAEMVKRCL